MKAETACQPWAFPPNVATATASSPKLRVLEVT